MLQLCAPLGAAASHRHGLLPCCSALLPTSSCGLPCSGLAWLADACEVMLLSFLGPAMRCSWGVGPGEESLLTSIVFCGMLAGGGRWGTARLLRVQDETARLLRLQSSGWSALVRGLQTYADVDISCYNSRGLLHSPLEAGVYCLGVAADHLGRRRGFLASALLLGGAGLASAAAPSFVVSAPGRPGAWFPCLQPHARRLVSLPACVVLPFLAARAALLPSSLTQPCAPLRPAVAAAAAGRGGVCAGRHAHRRHTVCRVLHHRGARPLAAAHAILLDAGWVRGPAGTGHSKMGWRGGRPAGTPRPRLPASARPACLRCGNACRYGHPPCAPQAP